MEPNAPTPLPRETIDGLDPRALLAHAGQRLDVAALLRAWEPPAIEEVARLFPQYEVRAFIGRGGMGAVYRARQVNLDRDVAIKLLPPEAAADDEFAARFRIEARTLARLQHPNIVAVHEFGQTSEGHLYFVMEYVDGTDLAQLIRGGQLQPAQGLEIVSRVCDALQFAHQHGVVHRDVKPANVLVDRCGTVKVADFGLAKLVPGADVRSSRHSVPGSVVGTPDYMAPEQLDGREVDARADIFSLGVMLYEMLTGQLPRGAWEPPSRKAQTDARLDGVVTKALQAEPARRYQQASEVRNDVDDIRRSPARRWRRWPVGVLVLAIVAAAVAAAFYVQRGGREESELLAHQPAADGLSAAIAQPPPTSDGTLLGSLDLRKAILAGGWFWKGDRAGGTLAHPLVEPAKALRVVFPARPEAGAYKLSFTLLLQGDRSDAGVVFPVGGKSVALMLNRSGVCGLELLKTARWDRNETSTRQVLPMGEPVAVVVKAGSFAERAVIVVEIDGHALLRWNGRHDELSADNDWALPDAGAVAFLTHGGGLEISGVALESMPPIGRTP